MDARMLRERYSVKKFDPDRKLTEEQVALLEEAFHLCPSSINMQPWHLVVVGDPKVKERLAEAGKYGNQDRIRECSHLLVLARKKVDWHHVRTVVRTTPIFQRILESQNISESKLAAFFYYAARIRDGRHWMDNQVYLALGFLLAVCAQEGIGALPMEGIHTRKVDRILGFPSHLHTRVALAVGYPHPDDADNPSFGHKARLPKESVITRIG